MQKNFVTSFFLCTINAVKLRSHGRHAAADKFHRREQGHMALRWLHCSKETYCVAYNLTGVWQMTFLPQQLLRQFLTAGLLQLFCLIRRTSTPHCTERERKVQLGYLSPTLVNYPTDTQQSWWQTLAECIWCVSGSGLICDHQCWSKFVD